MEEGDDQPQVSSAAVSVTLEERVLSQYELLRRIFANLPAASLLRVSAVCSMWKSVAETTLRDKDRGAVDSFAWIGPATNGLFYAGHEFLKSPRHDELAAALKVAGGRVASSDFFLLSYRVISHLSCDLILQ